MTRSFYDSSEQDRDKLNSPTQQNKKTLRITKGSKLKLAECEWIIIVDRFKVIQHSLLLHSKKIKLTVACGVWWVTRNCY